MPTFTRLVAAFLFAAFAVHAGEQYKELFDDPPRFGQMTYFLAAVGAFAGWGYVGRRVSGRFLNDIFQALQGVVVTLLLALFIYGTAEVFYQGYRMRYANLGEATVGFFAITSDHMLRMNNAAYLMQLLPFVPAMGIVLSIFYRMAERRRLSK